MGSLENYYKESKGLELLTFLTISLADCIFWVEAPGSPCSPIPTSISSSPSLHMYTHSFYMHVSPVEVRISLHAVVNPQKQKSRMVPALGIL